jgi:putative MFS transporter
MQLEFFDYFLIAFVLAFLIGPWKLTFGQSAIVLLSSGIGAIIGAYLWGWIADRIGRRKVFIGTVLNFSHRDRPALFHAGQRLDLSHHHALLRRPRRRRTLLRRPAAGSGVHADLQARLHRRTGDLRHPDRRRHRLGAGRVHGRRPWRLLFAIGVLPALVVLLVRIWVPESPRWLARQGRTDEARKSLAWALQVDPKTLADADCRGTPGVHTNWLDLFKYPRSLLVSWLGNAGAQTGVYGIALWAPTLFVLLLKVSPQEASKMMILLTVVGFLGRLSFSWFSEKIGRRNSAGCWLRRRGADYPGRLQLQHPAVRGLGLLADPGGGDVLRRWRLRHRRALCCRDLASHLKTSGMGSSLGFGGIGKIIGPAGLAIIVGSSNYLKPDVPLPQIPTAFVYLGCWFLMAGVVYYFFGIETRGKSNEQIDRELAAAD